MPSARWLEAAARFSGSQKIAKRRDNDLRRAFAGAAQTGTSDVRNVFFMQTIGKAHL
jgi:hypothetical protein